MLESIRLSLPKREFLRFLNQIGDGPAPCTF
jgi:hypothetical protein